MKTYILPFILFLCCQFALAQTGVYDSQTKQPIAYANIFVKIRKYGTNANEHGIFPEKGVRVSDTLSLSAIGYANKSVIYDPVIDSIFLNPAAIQLREVVIANRKGQKIKDGFIKGKSPIQESVTAFEVGRFFPPKAVYADYPYLDGFSVATYNGVKGQYFNISLRAVGKNGQPGDYLYGENLIYQVKKGQHILHVDLKGKNVALPEDGFYILFERVFIGKVERFSPPNVTLYLNPEKGVPGYLCSVNEDGTAFEWDKTTPHHTMAIELELSN
jgi:hypothetical protein